MFEVKNIFQTFIKSFAPLQYTVDVLPSSEHNLSFKEN